MQRCVAQARGPMCPEFRGEVWASAGAKPAEQAKQSGQKYDSEWRLGRQGISISRGMTSDNGLLDLTTWKELATLIN